MKLLNGRFTIKKMLNKNSNFIVDETGAPMGEEYVKILRKGCLEERWVDVYPNKGKRNGAFSWGAPGTHPFIMMSYNDEMVSLSTLAHELGHSMSLFSL